MRKLRVAIGMACCVGAGAALAEVGVTGSKASPAAPTPIPSETKSAFNALDTNGDGYLTKDEAQKGGMADHGIADRNADGRLDANEFAMAHSSTSKHSTTKPSGAPSSGTYDSRDSLNSESTPRTP